MEASTALTVVGSAIGGAKLIEQVLGPTAAYLGANLRDWTQKRAENVGRIFAKAHAKLGDEAEKPGTVSPRVLKEVLDEGSFCEDELTAEYFGGVLASARTPTGRDDRGAAFLKITASLSCYQIRFHYLSYYWFRKRFLNTDLRPTFGEDLNKMWLHLDHNFVATAMDLAPTESFGDILTHCITGLDRVQLLEISSWGSAEHINKVSAAMRWVPVKMPGCTVCPTQYGIDFWLWSIGAGSVTRAGYLNSALKLPNLPKLRWDGEPSKLIS